MNIYDTANQLEQELRSLPEFATLQASYDAVKADANAYKLFKEFQEMQRGLQEKSMRGEEFTDDEVMKAQNMAGEIQNQALINDLMGKEQAFSVIVNDLNRIIMTPVRELYND